MSKEIGAPRLAGVGWVGDWKNLSICVSWVFWKQALSGLYQATLARHL